VQKIFLGRADVFQTKYYSLSILSAIFPGEPGLAGVIAAKDNGSGGDNWSYKTCKAPVKSSPPTNQQPTFYRPEALPVAQPTASKHWRENIQYYYYWQTRLGINFMKQQGQVHAQNGRFTSENMGDHLQTKQSSNVLQCCRWFNNT